MWRSAGQAWADICLPDNVPANGFLLHPALLDACFQVIGATLDSDQTDAWLPFEVEHYCLTTAGQGSRSLQVHVRSALADSDADVLQVDLTGANDDGQTLLRIEGLRLRREALGDRQQLAYHDTWVPRYRDQEPSPLSPDFSMVGLVRQLEQCRMEVANRTGLSQHKQLLDELDELCGCVIWDLLRSALGPLPPGETLSTLRAATALGVADPHRRLFGRLLQILVEDHYLAPASDGWTVLADGSDDSAGEPGLAALQRMLDNHPQLEPEVGLLQRCATWLPSVLRGEIDPLTLLFPSDGSTSAMNLYRDSIGGQAVNSLIAETVGAFVDSLPVGRGLRVLEIGAGTGSTTQSILNRLPAGRARYVFTDIAASFLPAARRRFADTPQMDFKMLDIERSPAEQGFADQQFDVIVAANVIHATADLRVTMQHIHTLLAPGGLLVVLEGTRPVRWLDLTFGMTDGWWRFTDTGLRPDYPLLSATNWCALLEQLGFHAPHVVAPLETLSDAPEVENSVVIAQRPATTSQSTLWFDSARQWLVVDQDTTQGHAVVERLQAVGASCEHVRAAEFAAVSRADGSDSRTLPTDVVFLNALAGSAVPPAARAQELSDELLTTVQAVARCASGRHLPTDRATSQCVSGW